MSLSHTKTQTPRGVNHCHVWYEITGLENIMGQSLVITVPTPLHPHSMGQGLIGEMSPQCKVSAGDLI